MNKTLYIIRGVPGSGKSTLAKKLSNNVCEADDYFYIQTGMYRYDPSKIKQAHDFCRMQCETMMKNINTLTKDIDNIEHYLDEKDLCVAVSNTFVKKWEMNPYYNLAEKYDFSVVEIVCKGNFKNIHGVPEEKIESMRKRFEY